MIGIVGSYVNLDDLLIELNLFKNVLFQQVIESTLIFAFLSKKHQ